jgi:fructose transport system ATP-binding protein
VDQEGEGMTSTPLLQARGLVKTYGRVVGLSGVDLELHAGEVLAVIGDNGAGKSTLMACLSGAQIPDAGTILVDGAPVRLRSTADARRAGIETVYQNLAVAPALDVASNLFLAREQRRRGPLGSVLRMLDTKAMRRQAEGHLADLGISTLQDVDQAVETLSGGQRQAVAVARAAAFGSRILILDEPTAALGVRESGQVLRLIRELRDKGLGIILVSHNMPHVFELADRIHIQRLGGRVGVITPGTHSMNDAVAIMTGARRLDEVDAAGEVPAGSGPDVRPGEASETSSAEATETAEAAEVAGARPTGAP